MSIVPEIPTKRLLLRDVRPKDLSSYRKNFVNYSIIRHLSNVVPWPYPKDGIEEFYYKILLPNQCKTRWSWGIIEKTNPEELIGLIEIWKPSNPDNRGFWLAEKHWGKGYMSEAADAVTDFAFNTLNWEKLILTNALGNERSRRIKEKAGAIRIRIEKAKFVDPDYSESEIWELTKDAWTKIRSEQAAGGDGAR
ncbi:MAG: GNAT family N-acetyltransferase [Puniceicoccaceae bacterium]